MIDWGQIVEILRTKATNWYALALDMLPNFLVAVVILIVFFLLSRAARKITYVGMKKSPFSDTLNNIVATFTALFVLGVGLVIALQVLHLQKTVVSLLAGAGIIGLALAFAFQDIAANFVSGIILALRKPFKVGELMEVGGHFGNVKQIGIRTTMLTSLQGQYIQIPNKDVLQNAIINYTRPGKRRVDLSVGVSYDDDLAKAQKTALAAVKKVKGRTKDAPDLYYTEFGDSSINFVVRFWIPFKDKQKVYRKATSDAIMQIKKAFDKEGITIPFPIRTLDVDKDLFK